MRIEKKNGKLVIVDFDEVGAYKIACKIEKDGIEFYQKLKEAISLEQVQEVLELLLKEEKRHFNLFQTLLFSVKEKRADGFEEDDLLSYFDYGIFQVTKDPDELKAALNDSKKALSLGIAFEDKSIKFYEACKLEVSSPETRIELSKIITEEAKHKELLESILKSLK